MRLLRDTHVFLWWRANDRRLGKHARSVIETAGIVFVSAASTWEVAIKARLGRLRLPESFEVGVVDSGFERLPIGFSHAERAALLPTHHHDPFDRMLIAQAGIEGLSLVTHDKAFTAYDVSLVWT